MTYPIENLTNLEQTVLTAMVKICNYDFAATVTDLSESTGLTKPTVKGVVGSLVKKGFASPQTDEDIFNPRIGGDCWAWGGESYIGDSLDVIEAIINQH